MLIFLACLSVPNLLDVLVNGEFIQAFLSVQMNVAGEEHAIN